MPFPKRQSLDSRKAEDIEALVFTLISTGEAQRKNPVEYIAELPISGNEINDFISVLEDGFVRYWDGTTRKLASDLISSIPTDPNNLGYFATQSDLTTAHPTASAGNYALVGATDSFWVWDDLTNSWIDSGTGSIPGSYVRNGYSTRFNENVNVNTTTEALDTIFVFTSVPPTANVRVSPNDRYYEVGANPTINVEGQGTLGQNPQGVLTNLTINKDGGNFFTQANPASGTRYGQNDTVSITGTGAITTYQSHVDDDQGRSNNSGAITIYGAYPRYATTSNITTLTKQTLVPNNNTYFEFTSVPETGGKYKADLRDNITITGVQFYNTVSGNWEWMGGSQANSLGLRTVTTTTHTVQGNVINYNRYEHNGVDGAALQIRFYN